MTHPVLGRFVAFACRKVGASTWYGAIAPRPVLGVPREYGVIRRCGHDHEDGLEAYRCAVAMRDAANV